MRSWPSMSGLVSDVRGAADVFGSSASGRGAARFGGSSAEAEPTCTNPARFDLTAVSAYVSPFGATSQKEAPLSFLNCRAIPAHAGLLCWSVSNHSASTSCFTLYGAAVCPDALVARTTEENNRIAGLMSRTLVVLFGPC